MTSLIWQTRPGTAFRDDTALHSEWDRLNAERLDLPFQGAHAMAAALRAFGDGTERLAIGIAHGKTQAMLLLVPDGALRWRTFQPSQMPLGAWVAAKELALPGLSRSLVRGPLGLCLALSITQIDPLQAPREADAPDNRHSNYIDTAWVDIQGSFDDYWAARGKNLRQNMRKQRNKLAADGTTPLMRVLQSPDDMAGAIARYGAMESAGWKSSDGTAIHPDNAQGRFYTALFEDAARRGEARVYECLFDDRTVAMNLCLLRKGVLVVLKTTYDESVPKALSPAFLLREEELRHFFSSTEVRRVEYYGRVMDWHTKLTENNRSLHHLTTYRWPLLKALAERRRSSASSTASAATEAGSDVAHDAP